MPSFAVRDARLMAVKGVARRAPCWHADRVDATTGGKKLRRGIKVFSVAGGIAKLEFYNNLRKAPEVAEDGVTVRYPAGFVHLPKVDAEYLQQLCAEQLVTRRDRNGFAIREWQKMRERNEALDCYVYARAAAAASGLDRFGGSPLARTGKTIGIAARRSPDPQTEQPDAGPPNAVASLFLPQTRPSMIRSRWLTPPLENPAMSLQTHSNNFVLRVAGGI